MTAIEAARIASIEGAQLVRQRKGQPDQYDVKPLFTGNHRGWTILDGYSASAICAVYDAISADRQIAYGILPLVTMADIAFRVIAKHRERRQPTN